MNFYMHAFDDQTRYLLSAIRLHEVVGVGPQNGRPFVRRPHFRRGLQLPQDENQVTHEPRDSLIIVTKVKIHGIQIAAKVSFIFSVSFGFRGNFLGFINKYIFLWPMPLFLLSTHKQCILSYFIHNSIAVSLKTFYHGGIQTRVFLFLRQMKCPLLHAARARGNY
jgi:hypothetical protein